MAAIDQRALGCTQQRKSIFPFSSVQQTFFERLLRARPVLGGKPNSSSLPLPGPVHPSRTPQLGFRGLHLPSPPTHPLRPRELTGLAQAQPARMIRPTH